MDNLPLIELFTQLRQAGLPLGIEDYQAVLQALQAGFGLENHAKLAQLCCTLWIKSKRDKKIFDYHFEQIYLNKTELINNPTVVSTAPSISQQDLPENVQDKEAKSFRISDYFVLLFNYLIPAGIIMLFYVIFLVTISRNNPPAFTSQPKTYVERKKLYKYEIKALDTDRGDKLTIKAVSCPSWLTFKSNTNGTATLSGTEGVTVGNCKDKTDTSSGENLPLLDEIATSLFEDSLKKEPKNYSVLLQVTDQYGATSVQRFLIKIVDKVPGNLREESAWYLVGVIIILFLGVVYAFLRSGKNTELNREQNSSSPDRGKTINDDNSSETLSKTNDEIKGAESQQKTAQSETIKPLNRSIQITEYPPVTRRQMKQNWRYLRRMIREGVPTELDVEATIESISRQGVLLEPVIVPRRINRSKLLLLIDQDGSMIPFQNLSNQLTETAIRGGRLEETDIYYFHDCPMDYLYKDRYYQLAEKIDDVLSNLNSSYTTLLVFSDAGAARGSFNPERLEVTAQFLEQFKQQVRYIAWLNPMPRYRWFGTTASKIAQLVPMFELSRQGLYNAIAVLRGKSGHFGTSKL